ncbi:MAG: glycosyltransferase family 2 protein [Chloroflexota bacterium]|nr:glycosyltransferase family 2 protein [Chloroflexota bacterium]
MTDKNVPIPKVSIIIPCFNERGTIQPLLDALNQQSFPSTEMEVVIADGGSTDGTQAAIAEWQAGHPQLNVVLVENSAQSIPAALNVALTASRGSVIVRLDAHSEPRRDYVERAVRALEEERGQNVGGVWEIRPGNEGWIARSIAAAAGHPIGVGDARYRFTNRAAYVDTVPFGAFRRDLLDRIGMFDETLLANEDYEFNARVRQSGGKIWLDPQIRSAYYARSNLRGLAKQYWRYGYWKRQMLRRYPETLRWRQALPPIFVLGLALLALAAPFLRLARWVLLTVLGFYLLVLMLAGVQLALRHKDLAMVLGVPLAIATMHFSWGAGFIWSLVQPPKSK